MADFLIFSANISLFNNGIFHFTFLVCFYNYNTKVINSQLEQWVAAFLYDAIHLGSEVWIFCHKLNILKHFFRYLNSI